VPALTLVCGDILRQDLPALLAGMAAAPPPPPAAAPLAAAASAPGSTAPPPSAAPSPDPPAPLLSPSSPSVLPVLPKVVANLPYYITKDFLVQALPLGGAASSLLLMLQDEVAARLTAPAPGGPDWRAMNIVLRYYSRPRYLFRIDRNKYEPAPSVHGAVVEFELLAPGQRAAVPDERAFLRLVKHAFLQRRKTLRNALQPLVGGPAAVAALAAAGLPPDARAQSLSLEEFVRLAWAVHHEGGGGAGDRDGA
jgi:16S rRNA (adenine1518-N6/adenine1519-N6)-dimethyltransferase